MNWKSPALRPWLMSVLLTAFMVGIPFAYYRHSYSTHKRLRTVSPGLVYRSGCMTAEGFDEALKKYKIKTVLNLMDEDPEPNLARSWISPTKVRERDVCQANGAKFQYLFIECIEQSRLQKGERPKAIDQLLEIMGDEKNYPILIHCRAGLHRTGVSVAIYRMEFEGWTREQAMQELKANGFGHYAATSFNDYISQFVLNYKPSARSQAMRELHSALRLTSNVRKD